MTHLPARRPQFAPHTPEIAAGLNRLTNFLGPVGEDLKQQIRDLHAEPTPERWDRCSGIILSPAPGFGLTLWQALIATEPENTPTSGPYIRDGRRVVWQWAPTREAIEAALAYATANQAEPKRPHPWEESAEPSPTAEKLRASVKLSPAAERELDAGEAAMRRLNPGPGLEPDDLWSAGNPPGPLPARPRAEPRAAHHQPALFS